MNHSYLLIGEGRDGQRAMYRVRTDSPEVARATAESLGLGEEVNILDPATVADIARYSYGFQVLYKTAPRIQPVQVATAQAA